MDERISRMSGKAAKVLLAVISCGSERLVASAGELAKMGGISRRHTYAALNELEQEGLISVERHGSTSIVSISYGFSSLVKFSYVSSIASQMNATSSIDNLTIRDSHARASGGGGSGQAASAASLEGVTKGNSTECVTKGNTPVTKGNTPATFCPTPVTKGNTPVTNCNTPDDLHGRCVQVDQMPKDGSIAQARSNAQRRRSAQKAILSEVSGAFFPDAPGVKDAKLSDLIEFCGDSVEAVYLLAERNYDKLKSKDAPLPYLLWLLEKGHVTLPPPPVHTADAPSREPTPEEIEAQRQETERLTREVQERRRANMERVLKFVESKGVKSAE
jgi:hypothetical protein